MALQYAWLGVNMTNFSTLNFDDTLTNNTMKNETRQTLTAVQVNLIIVLVINIITCPLTVVLNVLVMMAVKRRPRLQSNANILLACLAATDTFTGVVVQPTFILQTLQSLGVIGDPEIFNISDFHNHVFAIAVVCSLLHLTLVTFERLTAIRFTMHYPYIIRVENMKKAVVASWLSAISVSVSLYISFTGAVVIVFILLPSCVLFIAVSNIILYRETRRHRKRIKTQQLPREEVERFVKENKAFITTLFLVGAVLLCFTPTILSVSVIFIIGQYWQKLKVFQDWVLTFAMSNSLLDPVIYCWRQREMRKFVFRFKANATVDPHPII